MKTFNIKSSILSLVALFFVATMAHAQFDDIYYSASSDDSQFVEVQEEYIAESQDNYGFSSFAEDDGYYYSSRIRRFSNPSSTIGYFSPIYTNSFNYGGFSPLGFNNTGFAGNGVRVIGRNAIVTNSFGNSFITPVSRVGFGTSAFSRIGGGGFSNAYYCPPVGGFTNTQGFTNSTVNSRNVSTVNSTRRSGSTAGSTAGQTRTARTSRNLRTNTSTNSVRTSPRSSSTRTSRSFSSPRSSSSRSFSSPRSSSSSRSTTVRSSSRGARG